MTPDEDIVAESYARQRSLHQGTLDGVERGLGALVRQIRSDNFAKNKGQREIT
jgi:hypothetical protein